MKQAYAWMLCICLLFSWTCASSENAGLPPAAQPYEAPAALDEMRYQAELPLYLPSLDGRTLVSNLVSFTLPRGQLSARTIVNALIMQTTDSHVRSLGRGTDLHLYGRTPLEVAGGICTINLDSSALTLEQEDLYTLALCLASTLEGLHDIHTVNLLIADRAVGLDVAEYLPCGSVSPRPGVELPVLWEQMRTRATPLGEDPSRIPLSLNVTLYFPVRENLGMMPEVRTLAFSGQTPAILAEELIHALSEGAFYLPLTADMPDLSGLLTDGVEVSELRGGGRLLTLHFQSELESRLTLLGLRPLNVLGALVTTLTTLIPSVGAVRIFSGSTMMTSLYDEEFGMLTFDEGLQYRRQYQELLRDTATIYLAEDGYLTQCKRTLGTGLRQNLPALLHLLSEGPTETERSAGTTATIPPGLDESDILGLSVADDTLLVNLSARSARLFSDITGDQERLMCYSLITTFCEALQLSRVRFFFDGKVQETLGGEIYWGGVFYLNRSLIRTDRG